MQQWLCFGRRTYRERIEKVSVYIRWAALDHISLIWWDTNMNLINVLISNEKTQLKCKLTIGTCVFERCSCKQQEQAVGLSLIEAAGDRWAEGVCRWSCISAGAVMSHTLQCVASLLEIVTVQTEDVKTLDESWVSNKVPLFWGD